MKNETGIPEQVNTGMGNPVSWLISTIFFTFGSLFTGYFLLIPVYISSVVNAPPITQGMCGPTGGFGILDFIILTIKLFPIALILGILSGAIIAALRAKDNYAPEKTDKPTLRLPPKMPKAPAASTTSKKLLALCRFIEDSRKAGYSEERIDSDMKIAGWPEKDIGAAQAISNRNEWGLPTQPSTRPGSQ
ncbi:MAG: hypothetical protein HQM09_13630 [Candidatus Riflebacteria bacterium]|nr:hypothetical protein [Candidatus Riflebacteria bacterium]